MATNPMQLLMAANIFGAGAPPLLLDPQARARALAAQQGQFPTNPFMAPVAPAPRPVVAAPTVDPRKDLNNPFAFWSAPQDPNEWDAAYGFRRAVGAPVRALDNVVKDVAAGIRSGGDTPAKRAERAAAEKRGKAVPAASVFPTSFSDPVYDAADLNASRITGVPAGLIAGIRLRGERTNAGVKSVAGANTPYQITPETRQGIIKNYKIDPWSSPENAALGAAYVLREQAGRPGPGEWNQQNTLRAIGGYFGGAAGAANPFSTLADANGQTVGGYVQQVLNGKTPLPAPFLNPYDPAYDQMALQAIGDERQALLTPQEFTINRGPPPEMPKPEAIPQTDFSKVQESLNRMRPVEMSQKEALQREREGFFSGIAQAMMKSPGNEGLGTFLMRMGGAALAGRMGAKDEIRREQDRFEDKMAQYQAAVLNENMAEATTHAREAQAQIEQVNRYNLVNYQQAYDRWKGNGSIDVSGTNAVITQTDEGGTTTVRTVPIVSAVDAAIAKQTADLFTGMGGRQFAGNQQITSMTNALIGRQAIESMSGGADQAQKDAAAAAAPAFYGTFIAQNGLVGDLLGPDAAKSLDETVNKQLMQSGLALGSKEWIDRHDRLVATELAKLGLADPKIMQKMVQVGAPAQSFMANEAVQGARTRYSTDAKGRQSQSTTMAASDIFGSPSQTLSDGTDLNQYGYSRY